MNINNLNKETRNTSIDLLKIVAMAMVVILHATGYGINGAILEPFSSALILINVLSAFSLVAVNCFVLICGYFCCMQKARYYKIWELWIQVASYSVGVYLVLCMIPVFEVQFSIKQFIRQVLPLMTNQYWFFTCYVLLMIIAPALNRLINSMDEKDHRNMLLVAILVFSVVPSINIFEDPFGTKSGYSLIWFAILYLIAAYIRRYNIPDMKYMWIYTGLCLALFGIKCISTCLSEKMELFGWISNPMFQYNSILVLGASIAMFCAAVKSKVSFLERVGYFISRVSSLTFGVYLLHEHPVFRGILWKKIFHLDRVVDNAGAFLLELIICVVMIFAAGIAVEWLRRLVFGTAGKIINGKKIGNN